MVLTVRQRLVLLTVLPPKADLVTLMVVRDLKQALELTAQELVDLDVRQQDGQLLWDQTKENPLTVEFSAPEAQVIRKALQELDAKKQLTLDHLDLCELFLPGYTGKKAED